MARRTLLAAARLGCVPGVNNVGGTPASLSPRNELIVSKGVPDEGVLK
jgi:hypothetical protein